MPASSSSLAIMRPVGRTTMSTSGVGPTWPAIGDSDFWKVLPPSPEPNTTAVPVLSSSLVTAQMWPSGPMAMRGSLHGRLPWPGSPSILTVLKLGGLIALAWAAIASTARSATANADAARARRLQTMAPMVLDPLCRTTPQIGAGVYACARGAAPGEVVRKGLAGDGACRDRTGDLLVANQALSQ